MDATKLDFFKKKKKKINTLIIVSEIHAWPCNTEAL